MGNNTFYLLDAGFNNLARPILYGSYHPMSLAPGKLDDPAAGYEPIGRTWMSSSVGRCANRGDIFTQEEGGFVCRRASCRQAQRRRVDLVLERAGAYGFVMASNYNSKPLAAEVLVRGDKSFLIRARQTPEDLTRGETIPPA